MPLRNGKRARGEVGALSVCMRACSCACAYQPHPFPLLFALTAPLTAAMYRVCQPECIDNSMCFQILGFDIMIDKNFRPWLIEVN